MLHLIRKGKGDLTMFHVELPNFFDEYEDEIYQAPDETFSGKTHSEVFTICDDRNRAMGETANGTRGLQTRRPDRDILRSVR